MSNRRTPWQRCEPQASSQWSWGLLVRVRPVSWGQRLLFSSLDSGINHFSFFREGVNSIPAIKSQLWWLNSQTAKILTSLNINQDKVYIYIYIYIYRNKGLKFNQNWHHYSYLTTFSWQKNILSIHEIMMYFRVTWIFSKLSLILIKVLLAIWIYSNLNYSETTCSICCWNT